MCIGSDALHRVRLCPWPWGLFWDEIIVHPFLIDRFIRVSRAGLVLDHLPEGPFVLRHQRAQWYGCAVMQYLLIIIQNKKDNHLCLSRPSKKNLSFHVEPPFFFFTPLSLQSSTLLNPPDSSETVTSFEMVINYRVVPVSILQQNTRSPIRLCWEL